MSHDSLDITRRSLRSSSWWSKPPRKYGGPSVGSTILWCGPRHSVSIPSLLYVCVSLCLLLTPALQVLAVFLSPFLTIISLWCLSCLLFWLQEFQTQMTVSNGVASIPGSQCFLLTQVHKKRLLLPPKLPSPKSELRDMSIQPFVTMLQIHHLGNFARNFHNS